MSYTLRLYPFYLGEIVCVNSIKLEGMYDDYYMRLRRT